MKAAAGQFIYALNDTPSSVALFNFSSNAPADSSVSRVLAPVQTTDQGTAVKTTINAMVQQGGNTNWDEGLFQIAQYAQANGVHYDAVLVLTDGDPTRDRYGNNSSDRSIEQAVYAANTYSPRPTVACWTTAQGSAAATTR